MIPLFHAFYWSAGFGKFLQVSALASHWPKDCANFKPMPKVTTITAPTTLSGIQASSQSIFITEQ
jgi:hypothetical protein